MSFSFFLFLFPVFAFLFVCLFFKEREKEATELDVRGSGKDLKGVEGGKQDINI